MRYPVAPGLTDTVSIVSMMFFQQWETSTFHYLHNGNKNVHINITSRGRQVQEEEKKNRMKLFIQRSHYDLVVAAVTSGSLIDR